MEKVKQKKDHFDWESERIAFQYCKVPDGLIGTKRLKGAPKREKKRERERKRGRVNKKERKKEKERERESERERAKTSVSERGKNYKK